MPTSFINGPTIIRATSKSYFFLCGIWVILTIGYLFLCYRNPGKGLETGALIAGGVALLWLIWLRGFKVRVYNDCFEYRNGFFRSSRLHLSEILKIKDVWIEWKLLNRKIKILRIAIIAKSEGKTILINPKPFRRNDLSMICEILGTSVEPPEGP